MAGGCFFSKMFFLSTGKVHDFPKTAFLLVLLMLTKLEAATLRFWPYHQAASAFAVSLVHDDS